MTSRPRWVLFWLTTAAIGAATGFAWAWLITRFAELETVVDDAGVRG